MTQRTILAIGCQFPSKFADTVSFYSNRTLLDADIIVLDLSFSSDEVNREQYEDFEYAIRHWQEELFNALSEGKTVFVFLSYPAVTHHEQNTLRLIPANVTPDLKSGKFILPGRDAAILGSYWKAFAGNSSYKMLIEGDFSHVLLTAKGSKQIVGAIAPVQTGAVVLLPPIDSHYLSSNPAMINLALLAGEIKSDVERFYVNLTNSLVEIDTQIRQRGTTPAPEWAENDAYKSLAEREIQENLGDIVHAIQDLESKKVNLTSELEAAKSLKKLLYETGHPLEEAILEALRLLGFVAENYRDSDSEFDSVFISPEGHFLGEAEGKDNSAINIDKIRQLKDNLDDYHSRDEVTEYPKGVLFGNAYRFISPSERGEFFTRKCVESARRGGIALVQTPDLFYVAQYLKEHDDPAFAEQCRKVIKETEGEIVQFPSVPELTE